MSWRDRVVRRPQAEQDITERFEHYRVEVQREDLALQFADEVERTLEFLSENPEAIAPLPTRAARLRGIRRWPLQGAFDKYLIFYYALDDGRIDLVRVLHGAQDQRRALRGAAADRERL